MQILNAGNNEFFLKYNEKYVYDHEIADTLSITTGLYVRLLKKFKAYEDTNDDNEYYFKIKEDAKICVKFIEGKLENGKVWRNFTKWRK